MKELLKDILTEFDIEGRRVFKPRSEADIPGLRHEGIAVRRNFISPQQCDRLRSQIDEALNDNKVIAWRDSFDSDNRIYGFESICPDFQDIFPLDELRAIGESYLGRRIVCYFALAARLDASEGNVGSGGGWHRDSAHSHQYKVIFYLSNVSEANGPFQYIRGSHRSIAKLRAFGLNQLGQTRFSPDEIKQFQSSIRTVSGEAGDAIFVDTRGIHRGHPIQKESRYAITFYFWTTAPLGKFDDLLQVSLSRC